MANHPGKEKLAAAQRAYREGRLPDAEALVRTHLAANPEDPEGLTLLGTVALAVGNPGAAAGLLTRALAKGERAEIHQGLGVAAAALGQVDRGIAHLRRALALKPGLASAHYNLGNVLAGRGDFAGAATAFRAAVRLDSRNVEAHANLGMALLRTGSPDEGLKHLRRAVALAPRHGEIVSALGEACLEAQRPDEAEAAFAKAVAINPALPRAWFGLGTARVTMGRHREAIAAFERTLAIAPDMAEAHHNIGLCLMAIDAVEDAEKHYRKALAIQPNDETTADLGESLIVQNREEEALALFRALHERRPDNVRAAMRTIHLLQSKGEFAEARTVIAALAKLPGQEPAAFCFQAEDRGYPISDDEIARALGSMDDASLPEQARIDLGYALNKVLERARRYDEAFACLARANAAKARMFPYDASEEEAFVRGSESIFTAAFLDERRAWGNPSEVPLFIVGMPRSGTTLTEQILASHAAIEGAGELLDIEYTVREFQEARGFAMPEGLSTVGADAIAGLAGRYLERRRAAFPQALRVVDKMHMNFRYVGLIALLFPNARFIHCLRDPMDNGLSVFAQQFRTAAYAYSYDLSALGHFYRLHERLMRHWNAVLPGRVFTLRYEDLVADPEAWSRRLVDFCGLEWDPACLNFHQKERAVRTASQWQVRQPVYRTSVERWRRYERQLAPLAESLARNAG